jgi:hypothetical protein
MAAERRYFRQDSAVISVDRDHQQQPFSRLMEPQRLRSEIEKYATIKRKVMMKKQGMTIMHATMSNDMASAIIAAEEFRKTLPDINLVTRCPVLIEGHGRLVQLTGYDGRSGIFAGGTAVSEPPLDEAVRLIMELLADFKFADEGDRSRAVAAIIGPALILGRLLQGRLPLDLGEADDSQTGKGYRNKITAAVYNDAPEVVTQRKGGVGGLEERFDHALIHGRPFISFDNIRDKTDSPALESILTENSHLARTAYYKIVRVDPSRFIIMMTSNRAEMTPDLAKRSSCVRILKQPVDYQFRKYPEGDLLVHVQANQPLYLGAVFQIVRYWDEAGRPTTGVTGHDFRVWAGIMDWIVQRVFNLAPLLTGHQDAQTRIVNPHITWLRDTALALKRTGLLKKWLRTFEIYDVIMQDQSITLPGYSDGQSLDDEQVHSTVLKAIGRRLSACFAGKNELVVDNLLIRREEIEVTRQGAGGGHKTNQYWVEEIPGGKGK